MRRILPVFLCIAFLCVLPSQARADLQNGESKVSWNVTLGGDMWFPAQTPVRTAYGSNGIWGVRGGVGGVWFKRVIPVVHLETNLGFGFTSKKGAEIGTVTGDQSGETSRLSYYPLSVELLVGIDIFPEQIVVPFGAIGLDAVPWTERSSQGNVTKGTKFGWHGRVGLAILLDAVEPLRAGEADATVGINDFYLVPEIAWLTAPGLSKAPTGLKFTGWSFRIGLKFVV